jgi:hypothetical protein
MTAAFNQQKRQSAARQPLKSLLITTECWLVADPATTTRCATQLVATRTLPGGLIQPHAPKRPSKGQGQDKSALLLKK